MTVGNGLFAQSGDMGAEPTLFAATQDVPGNSYAGPDGRFEMRGHPTLVGRSKAATDLADRPPAVGAVRAADGRQLPEGRRTAFSARVRPEAR